jgi:hypothetical protein
LRRGFAQQRTRIGAAIAEQRRRGFVDEADAVLVVDHDDALAQVLDDVLRQLREVGEIDLLAPDRGFRVRRRRAIGHASNATRKTMPPRIPVVG